MINLFREAPMIVLDYSWLLILIAMVALCLSWPIWYLWNSHIHRRAQRARAKAAKTAAAMATLDPVNAYAMLDRRASKYIGPYSD